MNMNDDSYLTFLHLGINCKTAHLACDGKQDNRIEINR